MAENGSSNADRDRYHIPSLTRALRLVEFLSGQPRGVTLTELVEGLQLPKNSVFRITQTLLDNGYLIRNENTMRFKLTKKFLAFGLSAVSDENIIENAIDIMRHLRDITDTTAYLGTLYGNEGVMIEQAPGGHPFRLSVDLGTRFQLHCGAGGKAMLAFMPEDERENLIKRMTFVRHNERTITVLKAFRKELAQIRRCGYSVDRAEQFEGVHCVGAPVMDQSGSVVAALWISGASISLSAKMFKEYGPIVREHAQRISARLGYEIRG